MLRHLGLIALAAACGHPAAGKPPDARIDGTHDAASDAARDAAPDGARDATALDAAHVGPDQVWFAGDTMSLLHYDGTAVTPTQSPASTYYATWGTAPNNVLALAWNGAVIRFDGTTWTTSRAATSSQLIYSSLFGFSASDVWGLGEDGTVLRFDGTTWTSTTNGTINNWAYCLWGTSSTNMWALGYSPTNHHWDGAHWQDVPYTPGMYMFAAWGASEHDIWAVGQTLNQGTTPNTSTIAHYDGTAWSLAAVPPELNQHGQVLNAVWGSSATDVWAVGNAGLMAHWNGSAWSKVDSGTPRDLIAVGGSWAGSVWAAGAQGTILHGDASGTWTPVASGTTKSIYGLWVAPAAVIE